MVALKPDDLNPGRTRSNQIRAAIYVRVSTDRQEEEGTSLDTQEAACRAYATEHGYAIIAVYREVWAGAEYRERPQLTALREAARAGAVDIIVIYAIDRLSRNQTHFAVLWDDFQHVGVRLECVTEDIEDSPT